jgi:DNA-binding CsgD family transcriptional regulator
MIEAVDRTIIPVTGVRVFGTGLERVGTQSSSPARNNPTAGHTELEVPLSARERQIMMLIASGRTDRQMADVLGLSRKTVSNHVTNILRKLQVQTRAAAVARTVSAPHLTTTSEID